MGQKIIIGGNRVGSGQKMATHINNYNRSTHNLSEKYASSEAPGVLYPCLCKPMMRGDSFEIKVDQDARTIPTLGPLFGSFKLQTDLYFCSVRLYQALLHNNPTSIGMKMDQVKLPMLQITTKAGEGEVSGKVANDWCKINNSALLKYLGLSGLGTKRDGGPYSTITRLINAIPALAYYDIFKNYYANKQEDNAYVIGVDETDQHTIELINGPIRNTSYNVLGVSQLWPQVLPKTNMSVWTIRLYNNDYEGIKEYWGKIEVEYAYDDNSGSNDINYINEWSITNGYEEAFYITNDPFQGEYLSIGVRPGVLCAYLENELEVSITDFELSSWHFNDNVTANASTKQVVLKEFPLKNIDDMRYDLLTHHTLGAAFKIQKASAYLPYKTLVDRCAQGNDAGRMHNTFPMNGLVLKTYQNDIFNNWLNTEWIEGENGLNEITKISVVDDTIKMDSLSFSMKLYNMLSRVAVSDGTYEGWQNVMYEEVKRRQIETPIFLGSVSQELVFDEIVQTAPADGDPLGTLGGRGRLEQHGKKGGTIYVKTDEAGFLIGITSLTPRIWYTQGNEFYMTDLESLNDFHKPGMDGIGFQDLIGERMAWFDTFAAATNDEYPSALTRTKIGKLPAWIEYMTSIDRAYGDFAETEGKGYMILNRNYEQDGVGGIADPTTYIDPQKYNYVFAYNELTAQNFWVEIKFDITARRLMSARIIPNV